LFPLVVKSVRIQRNRISVDGKYLEDNHEPIAVGRLNGMQLGTIVSSLQRVGLHDPQ